MIYIGELGNTLIINEDFFVVEMLASKCFFQGYDKVESIPKIDTSPKW